MIHCMIDLETLGLAANASILAIGAVKFNPLGDGVVERFKVPIDPLSCQRYGLRIEAETVKWWMQSERQEAREKLFAEAEPVDLPSALSGFVEWFGPASMPVWSNGATFDIPIMRYAFSAVGTDCPWKYWHERCFRTLKNLTPSRATASLIAHDALEDALAQVHTLQHIVKQLGIDPS